MLLSEQTRRRLIQLIDASESRAPSWPWHLLLWHRNLCVRCCVFVCECELLSSADGCRGGCQRHGCRRIINYTLGHHRSSLAPAHNSNISNNSNNAINHCSTDIVLAVTLPGKHERRSRPSAIKSTHRTTTLCCCSPRCRVDTRPRRDYTFAVFPPSAIVFLLRCLSHTILTAIRATKRRWLAAGCV